MTDIKAYKPEENNIGFGQVLQSPYPYEKALLIVREMADLLALDLVEKRLVTDQITLTIGYDIECLSNPEIRKNYHGPITTDHYGRRVPKHAHGSINLKAPTSSTRLIMDAVVSLFTQIVNKNLLVRRAAISANHVIGEEMAKESDSFEQLDFFTDYVALEKQKAQEKAVLDREREMQKAILDIKKKFGKNAILKGMNLEEGATTFQRNQQIGGHKA